VNFWPNIELDEYINIEARVSGRMVLLDISATGEENVIEFTDAGKMNDLEYRRKQLENLQNEVVDFQQQGIPYAQQPRFPVTYKSVNVGEYIPDLIVFDKIIVDTKAIEQIGNNEKTQIINYLKITGLRVGLLLNFKHAKLEWERIIL